MSAESTREAHQLLDETGGKLRTTADRRERSRIIDQVAAVFILESFWRFARTRQRVGFPI